MGNGSVWLIDQVPHCSVIIASEDGTSLHRNKACETHS